MSGLDPVIHAPARLQICAILAAVDEAQFSMLRDEVGVSDSVLSKHLAALSDPGYVRLRKELLGKHRATWVKLTAAGLRAFNDHVAALRALIDVPPPAAVAAMERAEAEADATPPVSTSPTSAPPTSRHASSASPRSS